MRLGLALPLADIDGGPLQADSFGKAARAAEELGYTSVWTFDAVGRGFMLPDPLMALGAAAAVSSTLDLGTGVMQLPIRNVAEVAHRMFTLELLAPGRVLCGVGPGSTAADFGTFGGDFAARFDRFDEQWSELRELVATGAIGDRDLSPWPSVVGATKLMLAGWRGPWVERAAAEADGWIASAANADDATLADAIGRYRAAGGQRAIVTNVQIGADTAPAIDRLGHLASLGFDDAVILDFTPSRERLAAIAEGCHRWGSSNTAPQRR